MFQQGSIKIANRLANKMIIDTGKVRIYAFGLELLLSSIAGVLILLVVSILGKKPLTWIPYMVGFVPVRVAGGGYHAKSHRSCILIFTTVYLMVFALADVLSRPVFLWVPISATNLLLLYLFSPVEACNKPIKENQRRRNRRKGICIGCINLAIAMTLPLFCLKNPNWITMYFAGSSMACLSMLVAVKNKNYERKKT